MTTKEKCLQILDVWMQSEDGNGNYKLTGPYWEVLYPLLLKHAPEKLKQYESMLNDRFDYFDAEVKQAIDVGNEDQNYINAINYMNEMEDNFATTTYIHEVDLGNDRIKPYIPNQSIDENDYWGRE